MCRSICVFKWSVSEYTFGCVLFDQKLAAALEQRVASQRKRQLSQKNEESCNTVSSRVREIAKSTLHFSDLDVDQFFSDSHEEQQVIESYHIPSICQCTALIRLIAKCVNWVNQLKASCQRWAICKLATKYVSHESMHRFNMLTALSSLLRLGCIASPFQPTEFKKADLVASIFILHLP